MARNVAATSSGPNQPGRRIIPKQSIFLKNFGKCNEDYFLQVFRKTWSKIPLKNRREILRFAPDITVQVRRLESGYYAHWKIMSREIAFSIDFVDMATECHLQEMIAHELAHVVDDAARIGSLAGTPIGLDNVERTTWNQFFELQDDEGEEEREARINKRIKGWRLNCKHKLRYTAKDDARIKADQPRIDAELAKRREFHRRHRKKA